MRSERIEVTCRYSHQEAERDRYGRFEKERVVVLMAAFEFSPLFGVLCLSAVNLNSLLTAETPSAETTQKA